MSSSNTSSTNYFLWSKRHLMGYHKLFSLTVDCKELTVILMILHKLLMRNKLNAGYMVSMAVWVLDTVAVFWIVMWSCSWSPTFLQNACNTFKATWHHNSEDHKQHLHCHKNLKSVFYFIPVFQTNMWNTEDGDSIFFWNNGVQPADYTTQQPRILLS